MNLNFFLFQKIVPISLYIPKEFIAVWSDVNIDDSIATWYTCNVKLNSNVDKVWAQKYSDKWLC